MSDLRLPLKRKWFDMTSPDEKTEDYREINSYWCNKLLNFKYIKRNRKFWEGRLKFFNGKDILNGYTTLCEFDFNIMTLGYPKSTGPCRIKKYEHAGIEIRTGKPEWGADPGKFYFVIKHGKEIK